MITLLLAAAAIQADSVRICVQDASSGAAIVGATVSAPALPPRMFSSDCGWAPAGRLVVRRVGYRPAAVDVSEASVVRLSPLLATRTTLDTQRVVARADTRDDTRTSGSMTAASARERGARALPQLVAMLPFAQLHGARGTSALSLRGARREQTVVTLDGIPLNDPSTGIADLSELSLSAVRSATIVSGASPVDGASGAIGGVLALQSSTTPLLAARAGALGERGLDAAGNLHTSRALFHLGGSWSESRNDFTFRNTAGASGTAPSEQRVNNDERRVALSGNVLTSNARVAVSGSHVERGMVGPMNVRTYDADRARTTRFMLDTRLQRGPAQFQVGGRAFSLAYRDPARPALDSDADAYMAHANVAARLSQLVLTAGAGGDRVVASNGVRQSRVRSHASANVDATRASSTVSAGLRLDAVEHSGVLPSFEIGVAHRFTGASDTRAWSSAVRARVAQAVRVPTLYDLYFSSPQRLTVRALLPERVTYDAELGATLQWARGVSSASLDGAVVARRVRDAIVWFPGNFTWSPANVGVEQMRGFESRAQAEHGPLSIAGWFSWYDSELQSGALRIPTPYVAREAAGAQTALRVGGTTLSANVRALGRRPFSVGPRDPQYELPATTLLDLAVTHRMNIAASSLLLSLSLENATNVEWQSVRGFPEPGRRWFVALTFTPPDDDR